MGGKDRRGEEGAERGDVEAAGVNGLRLEVPQCECRIESHALTKLTAVISSSSSCVNAARSSRALQAV